MLEEVRTRIGFGRGDELQNAVGLLIGIAKEHRVIGVGVVRVIGVDDQKIVLAAGVAAVVIDLGKVGCVDLAVDEKQAAAALDLLEHQERCGHRFAHTGLPDDEQMPHQVLVIDVDGLAGVGGVANQQSAGRGPWGVVGLKR